ncbi:hypothetical protein ACJMK2_036837 [Sinanodonta woodiana]|uniref:Uncharacterized protein n=1 Tax=Sinanodonta woodiana TaxID=1069815 RepID=A0ABD3WM01_SINWO
MKSKLSLYLVVTLLYKEANTLPNQLKKVSEGKLKRRIFHLWDMFQNDEISVNALLNKCVR